MGAVVSQIQSTVNLEVKIHDSRVKTLESLFTKTQPQAEVQEKPRDRVRSASRASTRQTESVWPVRRPFMPGFRAIER